MDWAKTNAGRDKKYLCLGLGASYIRELTVAMIWVWLGIVRQQSINSANNDQGD